MVNSMVSLILVCISHVHCPFIQFNSPSEVFQNAPSDTPSKNKLYIVISSDKGLCGGIHSSVSKATRRFIAQSSSNPDSPIMVIGDKSKAQLARALPKNMALTFNQIGRDIPTFADAAGVADLIIKSGVKYDSVDIIYNKFLSAISYEAAVFHVLTEETLKETREALSRPYPNYLC
jgi:F-type H+-transporting ATPase subunit gamma